MLTRGLSATQAMWPDIRSAYACVFEAAHILTNLDDLDATGVQRRFNQLVAQMEQGQRKVGALALAPALAHFAKVAHSYGRGLFHCYDLADLPRTNNGLEQYFGSARYHERRISGHKVNSPGTVVRGPARLLAAVATRLDPPTPAELRPVSIPNWRAFRRTLEFRHEARRKTRRFRRDPDAYLARLEQRLIKPVLPT